MRHDHYAGNPMSSGFSHVFGGCMGGLMAIGVILIGLFMACGGCYADRPPYTPPTIQKGTMR